jgi:beta-mannosidase
MKEMGFNAVRVHVHVARPEFYELCDLLGLAVIQDSDLSWFYKLTEEFTARAVNVFSDMIRMLRRHPSIFCWIVMNEPDMWVLAQQRGQVKLDEKPLSMMEDMPGPQLLEALQTLDPNRPYIKGSHFQADSESGDEHDYTGSITGEDTHYTDNYGKRFKLLTEYGMDLPGCEENLRRTPKYFARIAPVYADRQAYADLCEYRRRYLKYIAEYCRIQKGNPCAGYFQFLFSDVSPQSFYGIQDWWGTLKCDSDAYRYNNHPIGIFMEHTKDVPVAVWVANDTPKTHLCTAAWSVTDENGNRIAQGSKDTVLASDNAIRIVGLDFAVDTGKVYNVHLMLSDDCGCILAQNHYYDAFRYLLHPKGHPLRIDHELGMRLFWA